MEFPDQNKQVEMFLKGKVDIVVMDINIFNYISKSYLGSSHMANINVHRIFPSSSYHLGFSDKDLKNEFNTYFKKFQNSVEYSNLVEKYEFIQ